MDWGRIGAGVATGGQSELFRAGMGLLGGGGGPEQSQAPMLTPEQKAALAKLGSFAESGTYNGFTAGADVGVGQGANYNMTEYDQQSLSELQKMLASGIPEQYKMSDDAIRSFLDTSQGNLDAQFAPVKDQVARQMREADTNLRRNAGFAGSLYSTDTIRKMGDIEARGNETLTAEMARLTDSALNRKMGAIPLAMQSAESKQAGTLNRISAAQNYGSIARNLNNAQVAARDAEILRRRQELLLPIDAAKSVLGANANYGVEKVQGASPYADLLKLVGTVGGAAIGGSFGGPAGAKVGSGVGEQLFSLFSKSAPATTGGSVKRTVE